MHVAKRAERSVGHAQCGPMPGYILIVLQSTTPGHHPVRRATAPELACDKKLLALSHFDEPLY